MMLELHVGALGGHPFGILLLKTLAVTRMFENHSSIDVHSVYSRRI